ncbi:hypothetical protein F4680DRAFT_426655 [Xylaria scruposa]|nr:hypothetical protein F4680DRAFT_426655 [Xylaria scruposa]
MVLTLPKFDRLTDLLMASISRSNLGSSASSNLLAPEKRKTAIIFLRRYVKEAWQDARADVTTRWPLFFLVLWFAALFMILVIIAILYPPSAACRPDGTFSVYEGYQYWDSSGFFQITLTFGDFTFTQVKVIDIAWDVVVGRIGQGILAFFSWRTFADYATVSIETNPMTYKTFTALFMESGPSLMSIYRSLRDFVKYRRLRSRASTTWVILSMLFVLAWPTFIAAMSGYTPKSGAYVRDVNENFVPYNEFQLLSYIIHDGERINLTADYLVPYGPKPTYLDENVLLSKVHTWLAGAASYEYYYYCKGDTSFCDLHSNISEYVQKYGFNGHSNHSSQWLNYSLPSNSLNIEPIYVPEEVLERLNVTRNSEPAWTYANHTYTLNDIVERGACKTLGESFQWGFSYIQLFIIVLLLIIWTTGTCLLRYQTNRYPPLQDQPERPRGLRALILLAEAVKSDLEANGINPHTLTNKQLNRLIYKNLEGGSATFGFPYRKKYINVRFLQWAKRDLGWLVVAAVLVGVSFGFGGLFYPLLLLTTLMAYIVGTTTKSRLFLFTVLVPIPFIAGESYFAEHDPSWWWPGWSLWWDEGGNEISYSSW